MNTQSKPVISFVRRGLPGLLCIGAGLLLTFIFKQRSHWPLEVKHIMLSLGLIIAVGGGNLLSSYVQQRPFRDMPRELAGTVLIVATLLLVRIFGQ
ncbi:MAG: hypothetical protein EOO56_17605 [Hymenobacter sp.]|nr:MAG: hypothetical protein EOO56_17605 [Hymenobacter sp.]